MMNRGKREDKRKAEASFTVEASLLMAVILPVLVAVLLTGFYLHDRAYLQGITTELCGMGSNLRIYDDRESRMTRIRDRRLSHSLLWAGEAAGSVNCGEETVSADAGAGFPIPGITGHLMGDAKADLKAQWSRRLLRPTDLIWQIRGAKYLLDKTL